MTCGYNTELIQKYIYLKFVNFTPGKRSFVDKIKQNCG